VATGVPYGLKFPHRLNTRCKRWHMNGLRHCSGRDAHPFHRPWCADTSLPIDENAHLTMIKSRVVEGSFTDSS
jgi:hypothetical protein